MRHTAAPCVLLLLLYLAAAVPQAACDCPASNNWSRYNGTDWTVPPSDCQALSSFKTCSCNASSWYVGRWYVSYPLTAANPDYASTAGSSSKPWLEGVTTRSQCCAKCGSYNTNGTDACQWWQHILLSTSTNQACVGLATQCGMCILYPASTTPRCSTSLCSAPPYTGIAANFSTVGRKCAGCKNDPHFVGAHGTRFDFNGMPGQSFCLVTDPRFHINMGMRGYLDPRTQGASLVRHGLAVRTWIKHLGLLWVDPHTGRTHTLGMSARDGKAMARGEGYLGSMELDGEGVARMRPGQSAAGEGGLRVRFVGHDKEGGGFFSVDVYEVQVQGLFSIEVRVRAAHPLLQTRDDAMVHLNLRFLHLDHSDSTHGVLGQTFRAGREQRAMDYSALSALMGHDIAADSHTGKGFLDGDTPDYRTSHVLSPDCKYSAFDRQELPSAS